MAIRKLDSTECAALQYDQAGFDIFEKDGNNVPPGGGGRDHLVVYPGIGTDVNNIVYAGNEDPNAYWIGIHNCGTQNNEVAPVQAESLVGDDLTKDPSATFDYNIDRYIEIAPGSIIYGKFKSVGILKSGPPTSPLYRIRLIRGV